MTASPIELRDGRTWSLWCLPDGRWDLAATAITLLVVAASRFLLLPLGPWGQDENLLAMGILHFNLIEHCPHPPGFPLWIALGWLVDRVVHDPLRSLQLLSATASTLMVLPLARLGRRVAPPVLAALAALLVSFLPGTWGFAGRALTSTPASFPLFLALALAADWPRNREPWPITLLLVASFLVRPILLPVTALAGLIVLLRQRSWKTGIRQTLVAIALIAAATGGMILVQGSAAEVLAAFEHHAKVHAEGVEHEAMPPFVEFGVVRDLGGGAAFVLFAALFAAGLFRWYRRRGPRETVVVGALFGVTIVQFVVLQSPAVPRYWAPLLLGAAPVMAGAFALLERTGLAVSLAVALLVVTTVRTAPLVSSLHRQASPAWAAVNWAAGLVESRDVQLVVGKSFKPFASYAWFRRGLYVKPRRCHPQTPPWAPESWRGLDGHYLVITEAPDRFVDLFPAEGMRWMVPERLVPLMQGRYLDVRGLVDPAIPCRGWWPPEHTRKGTRFWWGRKVSEILLPPLDPHVEALLDLRPARGDAPLAIEVNGQRVARIAGNSRRTTVAIGRNLRSTSVNRITLRRSKGYPPSTRDHRPLAVELFGLSLKERTR